MSKPASFARPARLPICVFKGGEDVATGVAVRRSGSHP